MKYYILNKEEIKNDIFVNPILVRTKSLAKINKLKRLMKQVNTLIKQVRQELHDSNPINEERIDLFLNTDNPEEISKQDYNALLVLCLLDTQEQRIKACNKSSILKGRLFGKEIK